MPQYTRGRERDVLTFVKVTDNDLYYGFSTVDFASQAGLNLSAADIAVLGHLLPSQVPTNGVRIYAASSPKPPRVKKIINKNPGPTQQGSVSTFCAVDQLRQAESEGWRFVDGGRRVTLTNSDRTKTMAVSLGDNRYYLFPMNALDAEKYGSILGLQLPNQISATERNRSFSGASRPRPARVKKTQGDDVGFSTFCSEDALDDIGAAGFSVTELAVQYN